MAQFSHADFGGMSQWSPGMSMVGDMVNTQLKAKPLCSDIAAHLASSSAAGGTRSAADEVSYRSMSELTDWWPAGLGRPGGGCSERSSIRGFPGHTPVGDRRPGRYLGYDSGAGDQRILTLYDASVPCRPRLDPNGSL